MAKANALVLIPAPDVAATLGIDPGSGIVAGKPASSTPPGHFRVWFEGNRHGAINLQRWADRVDCAAGRMLTNYPTVAVRDLPAESFLALATYEADTGNFSWGYPMWRDPLTAWLGHPVTDEDITTSNARHAARRGMAQLRAGTPEQQAQAHMLTHFGPAPYRGI